jgi:hypothetical protein
MRGVFHKKRVELELIWLFDEIAFDSVIISFVSIVLKIASYEF